jgi:hypothetical protein
MHRVQTSQPRLELREFVRAFGLREMALPGVGHQQSNVTCLEHTIAFDFGTRPSIVFGDGEIRLIPRVHYVGSQTSPLGFSTFTGNVLGFANVETKANIPITSNTFFTVPSACIDMCSLPNSQTSG